MKKVGILIFFSLLFASFLFSKSSSALYVSTLGNDVLPGTNPLLPLRTIQHAVDIAQPGTTIKVYPGIYRESVLINQKKLSSKTLRIVSISGKGNRAQILGSEPSKSLSWSNCTPEKCKGLDNKFMSSVFYADISWKESPGIIVQKTKAGERMLTLAQSPNYKVEKSSKYLESLWKGENVNTSASILEDKTHLRTTFSLSGANAILVDGGKRCGQLIYSSKIDIHDANSGKLYFKDLMGYSFLGSQENGIGPKTIYLIQGKLELLDEAGEWYYDTSLKRLFVWPLENKNPSKGDIEIARRPYGIKMVNATNITIEGFIIKNVTSSLKSIDDGSISLIPENGATIQNIKLKDIIISNSANGIAAIKRNYQGNINNIEIENLTIEKVLRKPIFAYNFSGFTVKKTEITNSSHYSTYNAITLNKTSNVSIDNNHIHNVGANGIFFLSYENKNLASGKIQVTNNRIENVCESLGTCSGIKFFDGRYEDTIVKSNKITNNFAWAPCTPYSGIGLMISNASGIRVTNNEFKNNTNIGIFLYTRQLPATNNLIANNFISNSRTGILLGSNESAFDANPEAISTRHDNTVIYNNILKNNEVAIDVNPAHPKKMDVNKNIFINNAFVMRFKEVLLKNIAAIKNVVPTWEKD